MPSPPDMCRSSALWECDRYHAYRVLCASTGGTVRFIPMTHSHTPRNGSVRAAAAG